MSRADDGRPPEGVSRRDFLRGTALAAAATAIEGALPDSAAARAAETGGGVREYWIVARSGRWRPSPTGFDDWRGRRVRDRRFHALNYVATEPGFGRPLPPQGVGDNTGIPGPVIRAHPGDEILVHFLNDDRRNRRPHTIHPHGLSYGPESDGTFLGRYTPPGGAVPFGGTFTYRWRAVKESLGV